MQQRLLKLKTRKVKHSFDRDDSDSSDEAAPGLQKKRSAEQPKLDAREREKERQLEISKLEQLLSEDPYQLREKQGAQQSTQSGGSRGFLAHGGSATELLLRRLGTSSASVPNQAGTDKGATESADPQEEQLLLDEVAQLNEEYLEMMRFKASLKNTKATKLTQEETVDKLMQAQQD